MGAGVGGLTVAHELSKYPEKFEVTLIERQSQAGGQAQTNVNADGRHTSYCWHAISSGYVNLARIFQEIPSDDDETKTVFDHLKPVTHYNYVTSKGNIHQFDNVFLLDPVLFHDTLQQMTGKTHYRDFIRGLYLKFYAKTSCRERIEYLDKVKWTDFTKHFSPEMRRWIVDSNSIYLGMDYNHIGAHLMLDLLRHTEVSKRFDPRYSFYCFDGPINLRWFNLWTDHLQHKGVRVLLDHEITQLYKKDGAVHQIEAHNKQENEVVLIESDVVVNGLPTEALAKLVRRPEFIELDRLGKQIQTQVLYYLDFRLPEDNTTIYIFHESPWFLMTRHEGSFWDLHGCDLLSCGIGMWDVPGLNGKMAIECTREELAEECWNQMLQFPPANFPAQLPEWNIWKSFKFTLLTTDEPKFSNNSGTLALRPSYKDTDISNLYHATSYTKTDTNIFNMESGTEAGIRVARALGCKEKVLKISKPSLFVRMVRVVDKLIFRIQKLLRVV